MSEAARKVYTAEELLAPLDSTVPVSGTAQASLWAHLQATMNRLKAATGEASWADDPDATLLESRAHIDAANPHSGSAPNHDHPYAPASHVGSGGTAHAAATASVAGFSRLSTAPASTTDPIVAGTNDPRMADARESRAVGKFRAYQNVVQTGIPHATFTKLVFPVEEYDTDGWFADSRYTPQRAGYYKLSCAAGVANCVANRRVFLSIFKNGTRYADLASSHTSLTAGITVSGDSEFFANGTTDYFELFIYQDFGSAADTPGVPNAVWLAGGMVGA